MDPGRIAVMGDSGGGGLAAALALVARDRGGPALARQVLVYPMLDDRNTVPDVSPHAAPARVTDAAGLPTTYIEVGGLDLFRDEDVEYARKLTKAGVSTELHVHRGAPHGFEELAPDTDVARRSATDRIRVLTTF